MYSTTIPYFAETLKHLFIVKHYFSDESETLYLLSIVNTQSLEEYINYLYALTNRIEKIFSLTTIVKTQSHLSFLEKGRII